MTYYVVCVLRQRSEGRYIEKIGTNTVSALAVYTRVWTVPEVVAAIRAGDEFYCRDRYGERTRVVLVSDDGRVYLRTESDPLKPDDRLAARATA